MPSSQGPKPANELLRALLYRTKSTGSEWNVTGMGGRGQGLTYDSLLDAGKYNVPQTDYTENFLNRVHETIFNDKSGCALLERHLPHGGPILIDLDFKYTAGGALRRHFNDEMIRKFVLPILVPFSGSWSLIH